MMDGKLHTLLGVGEQGETALHWAACLGRTKAIKVLRRRTQEEKRILNVR